MISISRFIVELDYFFYPVMGQDSIGIYASDYVASRFVETFITCMHYTLNRLTDDSNKIVISRNLDCFIVRVIVDYYYLVGHDRLSLDRFQTSFKMVFFVVSWYNYANA